MAFRRLLGYAYMAQIKEKGDFGIEMGGMKRQEGGNFPEKKFQKAWGQEARDFSEKIFLEISKFCATSVAPRAACL